MRNFSFKSGWRNLWKNRTLTSINIVGLAIGMAAAFLVLLWVQNEFSFDSFQPDANREYRLTWMNQNRQVVTDGSPLPLAAAAALSIPGIDGATSYYVHGADLPQVRVHGQIWSAKNVIFADSNWFRLFHYDFVAGNAQGFAIQNGVVLTATLAMRYYGSTDVAGRVIRIDSTDFRVLGVTKNNPVNSSFAFELFMPIWSHFSPADLAAARTGWRVHTAPTYIRLKPGVNAEGCARQLDALMKANAGDDLKSRLVSLPDTHFGIGLDSRDIVTGDRNVAIIFGALGILLLLIACINYVNMATARVSLRIKEISMKKIMGASQGRLFGQFMRETLLAGTIALLLTVLLVELALPAFDRLTERHFALSFTSPTVMAVLLGTWALSILLTGIYPAILLSAFDPLGMLQRDRMPQESNAWVRKALVLVQFTAAISLIIGTIAIVAQLHYIQSQNEGYDRAQTFTIALPSSSWDRKHPRDMENILAAFKTELKRQPAISHATYVNGSMMDLPMAMSGIADWDGRDNNFNPTVYPVAIDSDFRSLFQLQLVTGRWFLPGDARDKHNYILNETAATDFGLRKPWVGQRFTFFGDTGQVVGVVKDFHFRSLHEKIAPIVLVNDAPWKNTLFVKVAPHAVPTAIREAGQTFHRFFPDESFNYTFLDEDFGRLYRSDIKASQLVGCAAGIAVFLSCLGLLGLAAFAAQQREKEIATRKILGASVPHIVGILSGEFLRLVVVSMLVACPIGWLAMNKWLDGFVYRTEIAWWMFVLAGTLAVGIAFMTISVQAIKAAVASPVKTLRTQ